MEEARATLSRLAAMAWSGKALDPQDMCQNSVRCHAMIDDALGELKGGIARDDTKLRRRRQRTLRVMAGDDGVAGKMMRQRHHSGARQNSVRVGRVAGGGVKLFG